MPTAQGWDLLLEDVPVYSRRNRFRLPAYSEFAPPPRVGWRPCRSHSSGPRDPKDRFAWLISEHEQAAEITPGLDHIARRMLHVMQRLDRDLVERGISPNALRDNNFWPRELAGIRGILKHERCVILQPLALSRHRTTRGASGGRFSAEANRVRTARSGRAFTARPGKRSPRSTASI